MIATVIRVLLYGEHEPDRRRVAALLRRAGDRFYAVSEAATAGDAAARLAGREHDVCLVVGPVVTRERLELLEEVRRQRWAAPIVVVGPESAAAWAARGGGAAEVLDPAALDAPTLARALRNATERAALAHALWESEQRFRLLADNAQEAIAQLDPDGVCRYLSPAAATLTGLPVERLLGRSCYEAVHPDDLAEVRDVHAALLRGEAPGAITFRLRDRRGGWRWVQVTPRAIRDPLTGEVREIQASARDVSAHRRSDEDVRLLGSAVQQSSEAIFITAAPAPGSGADPAIVFVNSAFERLTGWAAHEALGRPAFLLCGPETALPTREDLAARLRGGEVLTGEMLAYRKDGSTLSVEWHVAPIRNGAGRITHYLAIHRDITDRRRLEDQLRQSQKMEAVGRLAGGVAHDFNNLLTAIQGYTELLQTGLSELDPLQEDVAEIRAASARAAGLTRQLLAFSRKQMLQPRVLALNDIVGDMEKMLRRLIGEDVVLRTVLAADLGEVKADPSQLEQVLLNLAINARDAMPGGGRLLIETANVVLGPAYARAHQSVRPGHYVRLAVSDTGTGIPPELPARIFEPCFTTKELGQGTGLGLATVYGIVKQSGGYIYVYSEPGYGTTFKIYLPRHGTPLEPPAADVPASASAVPAPAPARETILLVEDEGAVLAYAAQVLEAEGYRVLRAGSTGEALRTAQEHGPGIPLLLTDVIMPGGTGPRLADRLRRQRPGLRVLYMSGYTENAMLGHDLADAGTAFLPKPFVPEDLVRRVREVLDA